MSTRCSIPEKTALEGYVLTDHPVRYVLACLTDLFKPSRLESLIHPTAVIEQGVSLGQGVTIGGFYSHSP